MMLWYKIRSTLYQISQYDRDDTGILNIMFHEAVSCPNFQTKIRSQSGLIAKCFFNLNSVNHFQFHGKIMSYSGTCLIRHTRGPGKFVGLYRMSEYSDFIWVNTNTLDHKFLSDVTEWWKTHVSDCTSFTVVCYNNLNNTHLLYMY